MVNSTASNSPPPSTPRDSEKKKKTEEENKSGKKMKQTRLSFASKGNVSSPDPVRKRKLSSPETEQDRSVKIVRREEEEDEKGAGGDPEASIVIPDDDELVEIIPCDDSNSAAPEEDTNDVQPLNESTNLDNNSSESPSDTEDADKTAPEGSLAASLEPPTRTDGKPLTPKQLEKFLEKKKRFEERQKQKLERDKKLEEEKRQKEEREKQRKKEREEKEEQRKREKEEREAARLREKEEKETAKQREKEEKETAKLREKEQKNEEKRRKEEQKEEERRRKEEEKRAKELEEEAKKKKAAQAFSKFFKVGPPKVADDETGTGTSSAQQSTSNAEVPEVHQFFMPFQVKGDMKLAPTVRRVLDQGAKEALEKALTENVSNSDSYLMSLKSKTHVPLKGSKTLNTSEASDEDSEDDLMVVDDELAHKVEEIKHKDKYRAKRLMFHENRRPAYYGTWQKSSKLVGPRRPFAKDEKFFDYEVDSDEEWEEEEPGESLHGSDDEKDKESEDDYEVDNEFFVPHGHLSDEEMQNADEPEDNTPEAQKAKLKILQDEFNDEMKKKTEKIKPRLIGCIWANETGGKPDNCPAVFWELLQFRAILSAGPIQLRPPPEEGNADQADQDADAEDNEAGKEKTPKKKGLADEEVRHLIRLVHGNPNSRKFMVKEFQVFREKNQSETLSGISIARKIKEIAKWETPPSCNPCWVVQKEFLEQFQLVDLPVVNQWEYSLTPKGKDCLKVSEKKQQLGVANSPQVPAQPSSSVPVEVPRTPTTTPVEEKTSPTSAKSVGQQKTQQNGIARFAKVLTTEEKQRQFQAVQVAASSSPVTIPNENKAPTAAATVSVKTKAKELGKESPGVTSSAKTPATGATPSTGGGNSVAKKRVPLLMSVPRGQAISEQSKNLLISNFLKQKPEKEEAKKKGGDGGAVVTDAVKKKDPPVVVVVGEPIVLD